MFSTNYSVFRANGSSKLGEKQKALPEIEQITQLASTLMTFDVDIYSKTYEEIVRSVRASGKMPQSWTPPSADVSYEYKWDVEGAPSDIFGPYSEEEMQAWFSAAYFGEAGEKVQVRKSGGEWGSWDDIVM
jgi:CD2 antigen cytoplasmic tail-binding protein 2